MATDREYLKDLQKGQVASHVDMSDSAGAVNDAHQVTIQIPLDDEDTTGTAVEEHPVFYCDKKVKVVECYFTPTNAVTASDTNYGTVFLQKRTDGGSATTIASITTQSTTSGGSGNISAFDQVSISPTAANVECDAGVCLTSKVTKTAAGVALAGADGGPALLTVVLEHI